VANNGIAERLNSTLFKWWRATLHATALITGRAAAIGPLGECGAPGTQPTVVEWTKGLLGILALISTCVSLLDRLTPTFSGMLTFRVRLIAATGILAIIACGMGHILSATHACVGRIGTPILHYTYQSRERILAAAVLPLTLFALVITVMDWRFMFGVDRAIEGRIIVDDVQCLAALRVDAQKLDRQSVTDASQLVDSRGVFVLDVKKDKGRPAYLVTMAGDCMDIQRLPQQLLNRPQERRSNGSGDEVWTMAVFRSRCCDGAGPDQSGGPSR
jgi:hypothetical protein